MADGAQDRQHPYRTPQDWLVLWRRLTLALGKDNRCTFCGEDVWDCLSPPQEGLLGALHYLTFPEGKPAVGLRTIPFYCGNCGKVEIFAEHELTKLAKQHGILDE